MRLALPSKAIRLMLDIATALTLLTLAPPGGAQGLVSSDLSRLRSVSSAELSPDGHRIAYSVTMRDRPGRPYGQLWIMDLASQKSIRVGSEKDSGGGPLWSPDGKWLVFEGHQAEKGGLFVARPDGSELTYLAASQGTNSPLPGTGKDFTWSPDGKQLAFVSATPGTEAAEASGDCDQHLRPGGPPLLEVVHVQLERSACLGQRILAIVFGCVPRGLITVEGVGQAAA